MEQIVEERQEMCSTVSKLVRIRIFRVKMTSTSREEGEIIGFECTSSSSNCESRCMYKNLLEDY